jgi:DNA-binding XRE family transcriptional regulator
MLKDNLTRLRIKAGLTQNDLAKLTGCTQQFINLCERGLKVPSLGVAVDIAKNLNCTVDDLIKE